MTCHCRLASFQRKWPSQKAALKLKLLKIKLTIPVISKEEKNQQKIEILLMTNTEFRVQIEFFPQKIIFAMQLQNDHFELINMLSPQFSFLFVTFNYFQIAVMIIFPQLLKVWYSVVVIIIPDIIFFSFLVFHL